jgi:hypothetical protein
MRIDRRLTFIGIMLIVLSMTMATQYATTRVSYTYGIVHPSDADIRFIGSDNSSGDGNRVLRVLNNVSGSRYVTISLGDWMPNSAKNYTATFAVVNEEAFAVNITSVNVSGDTAAYIDVWFHGNRSMDASSEGDSSKVQVVGDGVAIDFSVPAWILSAGDGDTGWMNGTGAYGIQTPWDDTSAVRYNSSTTIDARNGTRDWVWVQISLDIPSDAEDALATTGQIWFHFEASTTGS